MAEGFTMSKQDEASPEEKDDGGLTIVRNYAGEVIDRYKKDPRQDSFNLLLLGEIGSGKSYLWSTAPKPVHIDSFDPGGTKALRKWIDAGEIIVDSRWERENPMHPDVWPEWLMEMDERKRIGYFDHIAFYVIDSATMWSEAIMNNILKGAGIAGKAPRFTKDYTPQKMAIRNSVREALDLPCGFALTGHLEQFEDAEKGLIRYRFMTTGKGTVLIPSLFDEIWVMEPRESAGGVEYRILTQSTGTYTCRSRLSAAGKLSQYEEPDLKAILKKAGYAMPDKTFL